MALLKPKTTAPALDLTASTKLATAAAEIETNLQAVRRRLETSASTRLNRELGNAEATAQAKAMEDRQFGTAQTRIAAARAGSARDDAQARYEEQATKDRADAAEIDHLGAEAAGLVDKANAALAADLAPTISALESELDDLATRYASALRLHGLLTAGHVEARTAVPRHGGYGLHVSDAEMTPEHKAILDAVEDVRSLIHKGEMAAREHRQALAKAGMSQPIRAA